MKTPAIQLATDDSGTLLDLVAYEPGGGDPPIAVVDRNDEGTLIEEWSLGGAYVLGLQQGSTSRQGVEQAVAPIVATIFDGRVLDPVLGIGLLCAEPSPTPEAVA